MSPRPVDKELKRKQIMEAALELYKDKGFTETTVEEIAIRAGIGKGTVYGYFKSKEEVALSLIGNVFNRQSEEFRNFKFSSDDQEKAIRDFLQLAMGDVDEFSSVILIFFEIWSSQKGKSMGLNRILSERFEKMAFHLNRIILDGKKKGVFRADLNRKTLISMIVSSIDGLLLFFTLYKPRKSSIQNRIRELEAMIIQYLKS